MAFITFSSSCLFRLSAAGHRRRMAGIAALALYYAWGKNRDALAVLGTGYGTLQQALTDPRPIGVPSVDCDGARQNPHDVADDRLRRFGGVFGPSMVIGGCTGGSIGLLFHRLWPVAVPNPAVYTVVGMAGFFAGVTCPNFDDHHGDGIDRRLQPARPDNVGLNAVLRALPALDALRKTSPLAAGFAGPPRRFPGGRAGGHHGGRRSLDAGAKPSAKRCR